MNLEKMREMMRVNGWHEDGIAIWWHEDYPHFLMDGNGGDMILAMRDDHWFQGDNFYGFIEDEYDLKQWMKDHA